MVLFRFGAGFAAIITEAGILTTGTAFAMAAGGFRFVPYLFAAIGQIVNRPNGAANGQIGGADQRHGDFSQRFHADFHFSHLLQAYYA